MSQFKFILDGTELTDDPSGYEGFTSRLFRDDDIKGLFISYPADLTFYGHGYELIVDKFDANGYCTEMTLEVQVLCGNEFQLAWEGIIFLRSLVLNRTECTAQVAVQDYTYSARVFNNKTIPVGVRAPKSKNEVGISPSVQIGIKMFNVIGGVVTYDTGVGEAGFTNTGRRSAFDVMDALDHLVRFITDDEVSVRSEWYDNLPATERYAVMLGKELRLGNANVDVLFQNNFEDLYEWLQRSYNLFMTYEEDSTGRYIRVEDQAFFEEPEPSVVFENVDGIVETIKEILLYSSVEFGGKATVDDEDDNNGNFPVFNILGFKNEEYYIDGTCNVDHKLELTSEFITDHNIIYELLNSADPDLTEHDLDLFIVQYDNTGGAPYEAVPFPVLQPEIPTSDLQIYNHSVLNSEIIQRYNLQGAIADQLGIVDDTAKAVSSTNMVWVNPAASVVAEPLAYDDDFNQGFDPNNNYGNGTPQGTPIGTLDSFYTIPATGIYTFSQTITVQVIADAILSKSNPSDFIKLTFGYRRYDSGGTLKDVQSRSIKKTLRNIDGVPIGGTVSPTENLLWIYEFLDTGTVVPDLVQNFIRNFTKSIYGEAGDEIKPFFTIAHEGNFGAGSDITQVAIFNGAINEVTSTVTSGGLFEPARPDDYFVSQWSFRKKATAAEIKALLTDPSKAIVVNGVITYIDDVSLNHYDGVSEFQVVTNNNNKQ